MGDEPALGRDGGKTVFHPDCTRLFDEEVLVFAPPRIEETAVTRDFQLAYGNVLAGIHGLGALGSKAGGAGPACGRCVAPDGSGSPMIFQRVRRVRDGN